MNLLLLVFSSFSLLFAQAATRTSDLEKENMKGRVKSLKEATYSVTEKNGSYLPGKRQPYLNTITQFNTAGNMTGQQVLDDNDKVEGDMQIVYNRNEVRQESMGTINGKLSTRTVYSSEGHHLMQTRTYDGNGELIYTIKYTRTGGLNNSALMLKKDGTEAFTAKQTYLGNLLMQEETKDPKGVIVFATYNKRDEKGDIVEQTSINDGKTTTTRFRYEYDQNQNWVKQYRISDNGKVTEMVMREITYFNSPGKLK